MSFEILDIKGNSRFPDVFFREKSGKVGLYETRTGEYLLLGRNLDRDEMYERYGKKGRNVPLLDSYWEDKD